MDANKENEEFPVKVGDEIYGPIPLKRLVSDVKSGELTSEARIWDGNDWVPVSIVTGEDNSNSAVWDDDGWKDESTDAVSQDGPPLPTASAWEDVKRKGRWAMIYGDHLIIEGGGINTKDVGRIMEGEPLSGGIPIPKLVNVCFKDTDRGVKVSASSFHKTYEIYTLECILSKDDSTALMKELGEANVRIINN